MDTPQLIQGTDAWRAARAGSLGASQVADAIARVKTGWGASRANMMAQLICERLTGQPTEGFTNAAMMWGNEREPEARSAYEFRFNCDVEQVGIVRHPLITGTHASPDGLVGSEGLLEIKCPASATHIDTLLSKKVPAKYATQMAWQMACTGRAWCDFLSFDPRLPPSMQMFVQRVERDNSLIAELETMVCEFLAEVDAKVAALIDTYETKDAAE